MRKLYLLAFVPVLFWGFGCAPAASSSGAKKQMASAAAKEVQAKVDSRDYIIDIEWAQPDAAYVKKGLLHVSGDTLVAYTPREEHLIFGDLPPKGVLSRGEVSVKYKIYDYRQTTGRKGNTDIHFSTDNDAVIGAGDVTVASTDYAVTLDNLANRQIRGANAGRSLERVRYHIRIDPAGKAQINNWCFGTVRL